VDGAEGDLVAPVEINLLNISLGGAMLESRKRLEIGRDYALRISNRRREMGLQGVIEWSSIKRSGVMPEGDHVPIYQAGITFSGILTKKGATLKNFIENLPTRGKHRTKGVRYTFSTPRRATLEYPMRFSVKKLGMGGMLIEIGEALTPEDTMPVEVRLPGGHCIRCRGRVASCLGLEERRVP
jgi:hypothetical protein